MMYGAHVESTFQNTRPLGSALYPQDWTGTSTVYRTGPLCVCTPTPIHPDCYLFCGKFQGWLLQLWWSSCWLLAEGCEFADETEMEVEKQPL